MDPDKFDMSAAELLEAHYLMTDLCHHVNASFHHYRAEKEPHLVRRAGAEGLPPDLQRQVIFQYLFPKIEQMRGPVSLFGRLYLDRRPIKDALEVLLSISPFDYKGKKHFPQETRPTVKREKAFYDILGLDKDAPGNAMNTIRRNDAHSGKLMMILAVFIVRSERKDNDEEQEMKDAG